MRAAAEYIRQHIPGTRCFTGRFPPVSHFRWLAYRKELARGRAPVLPAIPRARCSLMWCALSTRRRPAMFVLENVKT